MKETEQKSIAHWLIKWRDFITEAKKDKACIFLYLELLKKNS